MDPAADPPGVENRIFLLPELALLSVPINLEYFYTKIRLSCRPALSALLGLAGQIYLS
jgi:hypothetical protein